MVSVSLTGMSDLRTLFYGSGRIDVRQFSVGTKLFFICVSWHHPTSFVGLWWNFFVSS